MRSFVLLVLLLVAANGLAACGGKDEVSSRGAHGGATASARSGVLEDAFRACSTGEAVDWSAYGEQAPLVSDVVELADDGNAIIISTPYSEGEYLGNLGYHVALCVLDSTGAPDVVAAKIEQADLSSTRDLHAVSYDNITMEWYDYAPDGGCCVQFDATIAASS